MNKKLNFMPKSKLHNVVAFITQAPDATKSLLSKISIEFIAFVGCSLISAFIDVVFISNLSKASYSIGSLITIQSAVLLGSMSIFLSISKAAHIVRIKTLSEVLRFMPANYNTKKLKNNLLKWTIAYIFYVTLSVITAMSLSAISIGQGISNNSNKISMINELITEGDKLLGVSSTAKSMQTDILITTAVDDSEKQAIEYAQQRAPAIEQAIIDYQNERAEFKEKYDVTSEDSTEWKGKKIIPNDYWNDKNTKLNNQLASAGFRRRSGPELEAFNPATVMSELKRIRQNTLQSGSMASSKENLAQLHQNTDQEIIDWIKSVNDLQIEDPSTGECYTFEFNEERNTFIVGRTALAKLEQLRSAIENDSGDIGTSSKIFIMFGSIFNSHRSNDMTNIKSTANSRSTELIMMFTLLFLSLLNEVAINQFAPRVKISEKILDSVSQYLPDNFDFITYMANVRKNQLASGQIDKKEYQQHVKDMNSLSVICTGDKINKSTKKEHTIEKPSIIENNVNKPDVSKVEEHINDKDTIEESEVLSHIEKHELNEVNEDVLGNKESESNDNEALASALGEIANLCQQL